MFLILQSFFVLERTIIETNYLFVFSFNLPNKRRNNRNFVLKFAFVSELDNSNMGHIYFHFFVFA